MKEDIIDGRRGIWDHGIWIPYYIRTETIFPDVIEERWFVYDGDHGWQDYDSEEKAYSEYLTVIEAYREEARDGWADEVEGVMWGKIYQTTSLLEVEPPEDADPNIWEGATFSEAFAIEHRK